MVTSLPSAKVADVTRAGEELMVMVHVDTNDMGKGSRGVLKAKLRLLSRRLKSKTTMVASAAYRSR